MQNQVVYEHKGKKHSATFSLTKNVVKTTSVLGTKAGPVGKTPPVLVARWLLGEMVREADKTS